MQSQIESLRSRDCFYTLQIKHTDVFFLTNCNEKNSTVYLTACAGVDLIEGRAKVVDQHTVEVNGKEYKVQGIFLANCCSQPYAIISASVFKSNWQFNSRFYFFSQAAALSHLAMEVRFAKPLFCSSVLILQRNFNFSMYCFPWARKPV